MSSLGRDVGALIASSRPVSWINTAFPFGATYLLVRGEVDAVLVVGVVYFLVPYNLAMYGINDVFDYASDVANPRKGGSVEGALLPPRLHRATLCTALVTNLPFLAYLSAVGGPRGWPWIALSAFAVVAYSAPGLRFKERAFLDSVTSSTHFVSPAAVGLALAGGEIDASIAMVFVAFFLWGAAAHAFGAVQDVGPDRAAGISSIATAIGARATVRLAIGLWLTAGAVMLFTAWPAPLAALVVVPYVVNAAPWRSVGDDQAAETNTAWRHFIWLNYVSGFAVTMLLIAAWPH